MKNGMTWLSLGALLSMSVSLASTAKADEVIVRRTELAPSQIILTPTQTVTTRTTTVQESPSAILQPQFSDETISRRTTILRGRPAASSSMTTTYETSKGGKPDYAERIHLMVEQLDNGVRNGWVTNDRAAQLRGELADLQSEEVRVRTDGYLKADCDRMEKDLTGFNIELSHSLEGNTL